jgi:hypothetical protein
MFNSSRSVVNLKLLIVQDRFELQTTVDTIADGFQGIDDFLDVLPHLLNVRLASRSKVCSRFSSLLRWCT